MGLQHQVIDSIHAKIHAGVMYVFSTVTTAHTTASPILLLISTSTRSAHLSLEAESGGNAIISLYESPTVTATGTLAPIQNRNRFQANGNITSVFANPEVSATGTTLITRLLPGGRGGGSSGAVGESFAETVCKTNTQYLARLENLTTTQPGGISLHFYEMASSETRGGLG